jgi:hypothetical protein
MNIILYLDSVRFVTSFSLVGEYQTLQKVIQSLSASLKPTSLHLEP